MTSNRKQLNVYVFGNENLDFDSNALSVVNGIGEGLAGVEFVIVNPNEDLPFAGGQDVVIMDVVEGLTEVKLIENDELE